MQAQHTQTQQAHKQQGASKNTHGNASEWNTKSDHVSSFVLHTETWEAISLLNESQRSTLMQGIFAYHGACSMPDMDEITQAIFLMLRPRFDANQAKYRQICEQRRVAGLRGRHMQLARAASRGQLPVCPGQNGYNVPVPDPESKNIKPPLPPKGGEAAVVEAPPSLAATAPVPVGPPVRQSPRRIPLPYSADFEHFWELFPRKAGKDAAWRAYQKRAAEIPKGAEMQAVIKAQTQSEQWRRNNGQFIPYPANWLNQGRWKDEISVPEQPQKPQNPKGW